VACYVGLSVLSTGLPAIGQCFADVRSRRLGLRALGQRNRKHRTCIRASCWLYYCCSDCLLNVGVSGEYCRSGCWWSLTPRLGGSADPHCAGCSYMLHIEALLGLKRLRAGSAVLCCAEVHSTRFKFRMNPCVHACTCCCPRCLGGIAVFGAHCRCWRSSSICLDWVC
jgi:hypothetical protein